MSAYYWPRWYTAGMKDPQPSRPAKAPACYEPGVHRCKNVFGLDMACAECPGGRRMMTFGSVFSGLGGFDKGLEDAGMACKWQIEIDPTCNRVLERHWPDVRRYRDVRDVRGDELEPVDLICGGWPCQDLSVAGQRAGLAGERSGLFYQFARIVAERRPCWLCAENVPGLLSSWSPTNPPPVDLPQGCTWETEETSDLGTVLATLAELGYGWAYRSLDLQFDAVAQRRERVFIVGSFGNWTAAAKVLFEPESCSWHPAPSREARARVASTITSGIGVTGNAPWRRREDDVNIVCSALTGSHGGADDNDAQAGHLVCAPLRGNHYGDHIAAESQLVAHTLTANYGKQVDNSDRNGGPPNLITHMLRSEGADASEDGTGRGIPLVASPITAGYAKGSGVNDGPKGSPQNLIVQGVSVNQRHEGRLRDVHGSLNGQPSGSQYDGIMQGMAVRRLTPLECTRLQSFPDWWLDIDGLSDSAKYRMLGNAVPPVMIEWIGRRIIAVDEASK